LGVVQFPGGFFGFPVQNILGSVYQHIMDTWQAPSPLLSHVVHMCELSTLLSSSGTYKVFAKSWSFEGENPLAHLAKKIKIK
jgi:hypothetical protein